MTSRPSRRRPGAGWLLCAAAAVGSSVASSGCAHGRAGAEERQAYVEAQLPELQACWTDIADQHPGRAGSLLFVVELRREGSVDWVDIEVDELGVAKLSACAVKAIKRWRFPAGGRQTIRFGVGFASPGSS
ncbi:AgmX/PglI C-terminal domain-containing protein [Pseudenhygromyxa sp. WMMC2535]|uniref:AgmX/PglI C-terminal domain-containing protein n=1 Tax=Pseudenhygromyxa sp. WMMC2535 TaxID=2712867 RepID=UPI0015562EA9|nr:AgmX/PglI C-terminal domain-containing protein [Pseudenhygromyxa sp. WMMC2535]